MRAIIARGPGRLAVEDRPDPVVDDDHVLVRIVYGGICGSDLHYARDGRNGAYEIRGPLVLGHEVVGVLEAIGAQATVPQRVGDRVAIHPATPPPPPGGGGEGVNTIAGGTYLGSASTWPHTHGGFTELLEVLPDQLRTLPDSLPLRRAALAEPLSVALHGARRLGESLRGARVLVRGAGPIGCLSVAAARGAGAAHVTAADLHRSPLEVARAVGADRIVHLGVDTDAAAGTYDVVVEAAGVVPSLVAALEEVRVGGVVLQLGMLPSGPQPVPMAGLISREITLVGTQRFDIELEDAVRMLDRHPELDAVISAQFGIEQVEKAFEEATDSSRSCKVLLKIGQDPDDSRPLRPGAA